MNFFGQQPDKKTVWILVIIVMAVIIAGWVFVVRYQITNIKSSEEKSLFQSIKQTIDEKKFGESFNQIKDAWNQKDEIISNEGFENKLETSEKLSPEAVEQIEQKLQQSQNKIE